VFYAAAAAHAGLGIWALYQRRQFQWKAIEPIQLVLGLSIPALIITHLAGVRIDDVLFQHQKLYPQVFYSYWIIWPYKMWLMFIVLIVSWVHGCIGLYFWLRIKAFFETAAPLLLAAAVLIPTLAMLGLYQGGRRVVHDSGTAPWKADNLSRRQVGTAAEQDIIDRRSRALSNALGRFFAVQFSAGCTTNMPGFDFDRHSAVKAPAFQRSYPCRRSRQSVSTSPSRSSRWQSG
jgi:adenylate cyclase